MPAPKLIIVIDDEEDILSLLQLLLSDSGHKVITGPDSHILDSTGGCVPDLIILDINLKNEDGRAICRRLKSDEGTKRIPILLFSAAHNLEKMVQENCADGYISKPFDVEEFLGTLDKFLQPD